VARETEFCEPALAAPVPAVPMNGGNGALVETLLQALHVLTERANRSEMARAEPESQLKARVDSVE